MQFLPDEWEDVFNRNHIFFLILTFQKKKKKFSLLTTASGKFWKNIELHIGAQTAMRSLLQDLSLASQDFHSGV